MDPLKARTKELDQDIHLLLGHPIGEPRAGDADLLHVVRYSSSLGYHPAGIFHAWHRGDEGYILLEGEAQEKGLPLAWIITPEGYQPNISFQLFIHGAGLYAKVPPKVGERNAVIRRNPALSDAFIHPLLEEAIKYASDNNFHPVRIQQTIADLSNGHILLQHEPCHEGFITSEKDDHGLGFHVYLPK